MAEGRTPTPAVSLPDNFPPAYTSGDKIVVDPLEDHFNLNFAAATNTVHPAAQSTEAPSSHPGGGDGLPLLWRTILDQSECTTSSPSTTARSSGNEVGFRHIRFICLSCLAMALGGEFVSPFDNVIHSHLSQKRTALTACSLATLMSMRTGQKTSHFLAQASRVRWRVFIFFLPP